MLAFRSDGQSRADTSPPTGQLHRQYDAHALTIGRGFCRKFPLRVKFAQQIATPAGADQHRRCDAMLTSCRIPSRCNADDRSRFGVDKRGGGAAAGRTRPAGRYGAPAARERRGWGRALGLEPSQRGQRTGDRRPGGPPARSHSRAGAGARLAELVAGSELLCERRSTESQGGSPVGFPNAPGRGRRRRSLGARRSIPGQRPRRGGISWRCPQPHHHRVPRPDPWPHRLGSARRVPLLPGREIQLDPLWIADCDPGRLYSSYASLWGEAAGARRDTPSESGWCSWYQYVAAPSQRIELPANVARQEHYRREY